MEKQSFWDRYARRYSRFVRADQEAYAQMLEWIRPAVRDRTVLELATGTGVIAHGIVHEAASIEATDASAGMIDACGGGQACKAAPLADAPCRVPAALEVVACGVSAVPAQTRLEGRAAPCAAGHVPADVCRLRAPLCGCGA